MCPIAVQTTLTFDEIDVNATKVSSNDVKSLKNQMSELLEKNRVRGLVNVRTLKLSNPSTKRISVNYNICFDQSVDFSNSFAVALTNFKKFTFNVSNQEWKPHSIKLEGEIFDPEASLCEKKEMIQPCGDGYTCVMEHDLGICRVQEKDSKDLLVGLAIGIPCFVIATVMIAALVCWRTRKKKKKKHDTETSVTWEETAPYPYRGDLPRAFAAHGSWRERFTYPWHSNVFPSPPTADLHDDQSVYYESNNSPFERSHERSQRRQSQSQQTSVDRLRPSGQSLLSDTATHHQEDFPRPDEQPSSRFSWIQLFSPLQLEREFKIQRPKLFTTDNV